VWALYFRENIIQYGGKKDDTKETCATMKEFGKAAMNQFWLEKEVDSSDTAKIKYVRLNFYGCICPLELKYADDTKLCVETGARRADGIVLTASHNLFV
jgi:hypothetical protein